MEVYDPQLDAWQLAAPMRSARNAIGAVAMGGKLVVSGGYDGVTYFRHTEVFDTQTGQWEEGVEFPRGAAGVYLVNLR